MKKASLILLLCCYSVATIGLSLRAFYCCGKLSSVTVVITPAEKKTCHKASEKERCCNNKFQFFKVNDNHFAGNIAKIPGKPFIELASFIPFFRQVSLTYSQAVVANSSNAPPLHNGLPEFIFNCVFRI